MGVWNRCRKKAVHHLPIARQRFLTPSKHLTLLKHAKAALPRCQEPLAVMPPRNGSLPPAKGSRHRFVRDFGTAQRLVGGCIQLFPDSAQDFLQIPRVLAQIALADAGLAGDMNRRAAGGRLDAQRDVVLKAQESRGADKP